MTAARDREGHGAARPLITLPSSRGNADRTEIPTRDESLGTATQGITERGPAISPAPPAKLRLLLQRDDAGPAPLDGGWWPRSTDPAEELPSLILVLDKLHGRVTRVMLGAADWNASKPARLQVGEAGRHAVRVGWFARSRRWSTTTSAPSPYRSMRLPVQIRLRMPPSPSC